MKYIMVLFLSLFSLCFYTVVFAREAKKMNYIGEFYEWKLKSKDARPDQIRLDPNNENIVWFALPNAYGIAKYNFETNKLTEYKTHNWHSPDGLAIDKNGMLWFGTQWGGTLGKFDPKSETFEHFRVPYKNANPAIPSIDKDGFIWIADHVNNKILRFDPLRKQFLIIQAPTPNSWVVHVLADSQNRLWYTCTNTNRIGMISQDRKTISEYVLKDKKAKPAFLAFDSHDNVWFTQWKGNKLTKFDPKTKKFLSYAFMKDPGPAAITVGKDDIIYFSTTRLNAIVMFDPKNDAQFHTFQIPTAKSGQKDGIEVDANGVIWFSQFYKNQLGRLRIYSEKDIHTIKEKWPNKRCITTVFSLPAIKSIHSPKLIETFSVNIFSNNPPQKISR